MSRWEIYLGLVKMAGLPLMALSLRALAGAGPDTIPKDVARGDASASRPTSAKYFEKGIFYNLQIHCTGLLNLRTPGTNPIGPSSTLSVTQTLLSPVRRDLTFTFPATLFFSNPSAPVSFSANPPLPNGSAFYFDTESRQLVAKVNDIFSHATVEPSGKITRSYIPLELGNTSFYQSGTGRSGRDAHGETTETSYHPFDGVPSTTGGRELTRTGNNSITLKVTFPVEIDRALENSTESCTGWRSPLYLFFDERRPRFTGVSHFPLDPMGRPVRWVEKDAPGYLLVLDRNRDGKISQASEVFGDNEASTNGFEVLRELDSNLDNRIDAKDAQFLSLQLWADRNGDAITQMGELVSLTDKKVRSIDLNYDSKNIMPLASGAELRQRSKFKFIGQNGKLQTGDIIDVWLGVVDVQVTSAPPIILYDTGLLPAMNVFSHPLSTPRRWMKGGL